MRRERLPVPVWGGNFELFVKAVDNKKILRIICSWTNSKEANKSDA